MLALLTLLAQAHAPIAFAAELEDALPQREQTLQPIVVEALAEGRLRIELRLNEDATVLELERTPVRAPNYRLFVHREDGRLETAPVGSGLTYAGLSESGSRRAVAGFDGERLFASIRDLETGVVFDVRAAQVVSGQALVQANAPAGVGGRLLQPASPLPAAASPLTAHRARVRGRRRLRGLHPIWLDPSPRRATGDHDPRTDERRALKRSARDRRPRDPQPVERAGRAHQPGGPVLE